MRRRALVCTAAGLTLLVLATVAALWGPRLRFAFMATPASPAPAAATPSVNPESPPEDPPPTGLPIVAWGKRGHYRILRTPEYVDAERGDRLLATDEPVLGLVLGKEVRAYSTNQLNQHEMVVDTIAGVPVLVTY